MPKKKQSASAPPAPSNIPVPESPLGKPSELIGVMESEPSDSQAIPGVISPAKLLSKIQKLASAADYLTILDEIVHTQPDPAFEKAEFILVNPDPEETFYRYLLKCTWRSERGVEAAPAGTYLPFATFNAYFETQQAFFSQDTTTDPALDENARHVLGMDGEAISIGIIPLQSGGRQVGVIVLSSTRPGAFSDQELAEIPLLAPSAALAADRLKLTRQAELEQVEKQSLAAAAAALAGATSYAGILDAIREHTFLGCDSTRMELAVFDTVWTESEVPQSLEVRSIWDEAGDVEIKGRRLLISDIPHARKLLTPDSPAILQDSAHKDSLDVHKFLQEYHAERCVWLPLVSGNRWFGLIWSMQSSNRPVSDSEIGLAKSAAHQASLAAENLDSRAFALQSSQYSAVLFQAAQLLATAGSEKEIFQITLQAAMQALEVQSVYVHVSAIDQDKPVMRQAACLAGERVPLQRNGSIFPARLFPYYDQFMAGQSTSTGNAQIDERLTDTARRYFQLLQGTAVAEVPLPVRGQAYGVLLAVRSHPDPFTVAEMGFLESLSGQAGAAIENFRLLLETRSAAREAHERTLELSLINRVVSSVSSSRDLKSGLQAVVDELVESFALASSGIALLNDERTFLEIAAERHRDGSPASNSQIPVKGNPSTMRVLETRKPLVIPDAQHNPLTTPIHSLMLRRGIQTLVLLPLIVNNEVIGTVGMDIQEPERTISKDEIRLAETIVFQAAVAIQNARLLDQTQRALSETELLYRISQSVASASSTSELALLVIENALPAQADKLIFMFYQPVLGGEGREIEIAGRCEHRSDYVPDGTRFPTADLPLLDQIGTQPFMIKDYKTADLDTRSIETLIRMEFISGCILPLRTAGQQIGFMVVSSPQVTQYSPAEIRNLQLTADGIAVALEKQRLLLQAQRRAVELQTAALVARETSSTLDLDVLLKRMVNVLCERFGFYHASVFLLDEEREFAVVRESTGLAGEEMKLRGHKLAVGSRSIIGSVTATGTPLVVNDVSRSETHRKNPLLPNTRAELGIPLKLGDRIIGALDVQSTQVNAFHPDDVAVLQILADQIAVAIENAKAYTISLQAVDDMREADKMKSKFLANMSHELRTPLNSIIGFSRVILKGIDGPVTDIQQQDLTAIYNSGQHLLRLINDILDLSKIEAGKMELSFNDVNVQELVNSVMSTATGLIKDKQIKLNRSIPNDLPLVRGDSVRLRQVLINLISNAAKFTDHGTITVDASQQSGPNSMAEVIIRIIDTGQGISPEHQRKLFLPFSQVDDSPTRKTGGTGLGLSISKSLMDMHGGRIGLEKSRVGEGSTFFFTLPVSGSVPVSAAAGSPSMSILAIDPDPRVIRLYQSHLEPQGYQIVPLVDASIAGYHAQRLKPLAVILDVTPRDHSGWKAVKQLRADPETSGVPMVLCSLIQEEEIGFCLGITEFLNKPLKSEVLTSALARLGLNVKFRELLIVDDNVDDLKAIQQSFEDSPNTFLTFAKDAWQARALLSKRKPSAVIMDLIKPDLYRLDLIKELRANPEYGNIPLIFLIGMDRLQENIDQLDHFNQELLAKLLTKPDSILNSLDKILASLRQPARTV